MQCSIVPPAHAMSAMSTRPFGKYLYCVETESEGAGRHGALHDKGDGRTSRVKQLLPQSPSSEVELSVQVLEAY